MSGAGFHEGGCLCGALRYRFVGPVHSPHFCSCRMCQRVTGAPTVAWGNVARDRFAWIGTGGEPVWYRSSERTLRGHCATCGGGAVCLDDGADMVCISLASLDDPESALPTRHIYADGAATWLKLDGDLKETFNG